MKQLLILVLLSPIFVCSQIFDSTSDTIKTKYIGEIRNSLKYKNNFYFFTETENNAYPNIETLHFYKMDPSGNTTKIIVPKDLRNVYRDLYVKNDSIYAVEYWNKNTFFLDSQKNEWIKSEQATDTIYEDKFYTIYSVDLGEFGGYTWFINKQTKKEYSLEIYLNNALKFDNKFILSNSNVIIEILKPEDLNKALFKYKVFNVEKEKNSELMGQLINSKKVSKKIKILFHEKNDIEPAIVLHSSFLFNGKLYFCYTTKGKATIGEFTNGKFDDKFKFGNDIEIFQYYYDYRNENNSTGRSMQFRTPNEYLNGIIVINDNKIYLNYIENLNKTPILTEDETMKWFKECFSFYSENIKTMNYNTVAIYENQINSFSILLNKGLNTYRTKEINNIVLTKEYYFSQENDRLKHLTFFWDYKGEVNSHHDNIKTGLPTDKKSKLILMFLTEKFGKPTKQENYNDNESSYDWNLANQNISLFISKKRVAVDLENK